MICYLLDLDKQRRVQAAFEGLRNRNERAINDKPITTAMICLMRTSRQTLRLAVAVWSLTFIVVFGAASSAQANYITKAEADSFYSLKVKLIGLTSDMQQTVRQARGQDHSVLLCLSTITYEARLAALSAVNLGELITLAATLRDEDDEFVVLHELRAFLVPTIQSLAAHREVINGAMTTCSNVATANVKGQALITVLSEMDHMLGPLAARVERAPN